jgi:hypothetical protein
MRGLVLVATLCSTVAWAQPGDAALHHRLRAAAIATSGLAFAALLAGAGAYGAGARSYGDLYTSTCVSRPCTPSDWSGAQTSANAGYGLFAGAGAAAAAAVTLWILQVRY